MILILLFIANLKTQSINFCSQGCQMFKNNSTECDSFIPLCSWKKENNTCIKGYVKQPINIYIQQSTQFCSQNKEKCSKTFGCSYYNDICIKFLGCEAYKAYSDQDCLNISYLCIWDDKKQQCIRSHYYDQRGNIIDKRDCNLAISGWRSKEGCPKYSSQCIFNGIFCTESLGNCNQYQTTQENCNKLIGVDGLCEYYKDNNCKTKKCQDYNQTQCTDYRSNCYLDKYNNCQKKQKCLHSKYVIKKTECENTLEQNCYFDGRTCSLIPLKFCEEYSNSECQGTVGKMGICIYQDDKCIKLDCQNDLTKLYKNMEIFDDYCQEINVCEQKNRGCSENVQLECSNIIKTSEDCKCQKCTINKQECMYASTQLECVQNYQLNTNIPCYWNQDYNSCESATRCSQLYSKSTCLRLKPSCVFRNNNCVDLLELECTQIQSIENQDQILKQYCILSRGCAIFNSNCITLRLNCENYESEATCFKDGFNQPCVWNLEIKKCLSYKESKQLLKVECELMSSLWIYQNDTCKIKQSCALLNDNEIGLEGNCTIYKLEQIQYSVTSCSDITNAKGCQYYNKSCRYYNNTCLNLSCSDLNSTTCKPIQGFTIQDYKYCRLFGMDCIETLPINEKDCLLYSGGSKFFLDNYCISCIRNDQCKISSLPYLQLEPNIENIQSKLSIIMIIFYILIIQ